MRCLVCRRPAPNVVGVILLLVASIGAGAANAQPAVLRVTIVQVEAINDYDEGSQADHYVRVAIPGQEVRTSTIDERDRVGSDEEPAWEVNFNVDRADFPMPGRIELWDSDGLLNPDDHIDIGIEAGSDLLFQVELDPCRLYADISPPPGEPLDEYECGFTIVTGGTATNRAAMRFRVELIEPPTTGSLAVECRHSPIHPQAGDSVTIEATPREIVPPPTEANSTMTPVAVADVLEIWVDDPSAPAQSATTSNGLSYTLPPVEDGTTFDYGCRATSGGRVAWTGWRKVAVGELAYDHEVAVPILYTGPRTSRIDVVFYADADSYAGALDPTYLGDVQDMMHEVFLNWWFFLENQHAFNFWISRLTGKAGRGSFLGLEWCEADGAIEPLIFEESGVVLHTDIFRDCADRGKPFWSVEPPRFDTDPDQTRLAWRTGRHEFGHRPFGLADEYAGRAGHFEADPFPNLHEDQEGCEDDAPDLGRTATACRSIRADLAWQPNENFFLSDPATDDLMVGLGTVEPRAADLRRMRWVLERQRAGRAGAAFAALALEPEPVSPESDAPPAFDDASGSKAFVAWIGFEGRLDAALETVEVVFDVARSPVGNPPLLRVDLWDANGTKLDSFNEWHPLWGQEEAADASGPADEVTILEEEQLFLAFPFDPELDHLTLTDIPLGEEVLEADLSAAVREFCEENPEDPDCEVTDLRVEDVTVVAGPPLVVLGSPEVLSVRTTVANGGPTSPVLARVIRSVAASQGLSVTPADDLADELLLEAAGSATALDADYTLECLAPGVQTASFTSVIDAVRAATVDLDSSNDSRVLDVRVDCAVPVVINVKPGESPNPVELRSASVPVAILTTAAGEYGLPLPFDATSIDASTLRFGSRANVGGGTDGAPESHVRIHPEDGLELDDVTLDGDLDAMTHFQLRSSGLTPADLEACVRGRTLGGSVGFLGCDEVLVGRSQEGAP